MGRFVKFYIVLLLLLLPVLKSTAQFSFNFNERCQQAYHKLIQLKITEARQLINLEKRTNPENLIPFFLDNYAITFEVLFNGNHSDYDSFLKESEKNLEQIKKGSSSSPYYLYTQAVMNLQLAACKYKFNDMVGAFWNVRRAYLEITKNVKNYPHFAPNEIVLGPMKALVGSIPPGYRWATGLLGFKDGSVNGGISLIRSFLTEDQGEMNFFKEEAVFYYAYMIFYLEKDASRAISVINSRQLDLKNNILYAFMAANIYLNNHAADKAVKVLKERNTSSEYMAMPIMNYELANAYLNHLKLDEAIREFKYFLAHYEGQVYVKDALYRLSWAYDFKGDYANATKYKKKVLSEGSMVTDADKVAEREVKSDVKKNPVILQASLLMDGGYFDEALQKLLSVSSVDFHRLVDKVGYSYFLARVRDEMGENDKALHLYEKTLEAGHDLPEFYAARAALQMGLIYEKRGKKQKALAYFQKCLDMPNKEYKESLDQRAKSGINRMTVK